MYVPLYLTDLFSQDAGASCAVLHEPSRRVGSYSIKPQPDFETPTSW